MSWRSRPNPGPLCPEAGGISEPGRETRWMGHEGKPLMQGGLPEKKNPVRDLCQSLIHDRVFGFGLIRRNSGRSVFVFPQVREMLPTAS